MDTLGDMYKLREVDKMLLLQSAAGTRANVLDQLVIEFHAGSTADLLTSAARWTARHPEWTVVDMRYSSRERDERVCSLALYVDPTE